MQIRMLYGRVENGGALRRGKAPIEYASNIMQAMTGFKIPVAELEGLREQQGDRL